MKTLDEALAFVKNWEGAADGRDKERFAVFVPFDRIAEAGFELNDGVDLQSWGPADPWEECRVLEQLRRDTLFGLEKARDRRGLSASFMFTTVNMWCHLLENGLHQHSYTNYGVPFFESILRHYGWPDESN